MLPPPLAASDIFPGLNRSSVAIALTSPFVVTKCQVPVRGVVVIDRGLCGLLLLRLCLWCSSSTSTASRSSCRAYR
jgi:hypothetical protein